MAKKRIFDCPGQLSFWGLGVEFDETSPASIFRASEAAALPEELEEIPLEVVGPTAPPASGIDAPKVDPETDATVEIPSIFHGDAGDDDGPRATVFFDLGADPLDEPELWTPPADFALPANSDDRMDANDQAAQLLDQLLTEDRVPTEAEAVTLARYTGGILRNCPENLSQKEKNAARTTTATSYTSSTWRQSDEQAQEAVIEIAKQAARRFAPNGASVLFAGCTVPALPSLLGENFRRGARISLLSHDPIAARIGQLIHKNCDVRWDIPDLSILTPSGYDMVIVGSDKQWTLPHYRRKRKDALEASVSALAPGGVLIHAIQKDFLERLSATARVSLGDSLDIQGAALFAHTYKSIALLLGIKREAGRIDYDSNPLTNLTVFLSNSMTRQESLGGPLELARMAIEEMPDARFSPKVRMRPSASDLGVPVEFNSYAVAPSGKLLCNFSGAPNIVEFLDPTEEKKMVLLVQIRDGVRSLQRSKATDTTTRFLADQNKLKDLHREFLSLGIGPIHDHVKSLPRSVDRMLVCATETKLPDGSYKPGNLLTLPAPERERVVGITTPRDALLASFKATGRVDFDAIAQILGSDAETVQSVLRKSGDIYIDPISSRPLFRDEFLSGDVVGRLEQAKLRALSDNGFEAEVSALEASQPPRTAIAEIEMTPGASWVPEEMIEEFGKEVFGANLRAKRENGRWSIQTPARKDTNPAMLSTANTDTYAVKAGRKIHKTGTELFRSLLNRHGVVEIFVEPEDSPTGKRVLDESLTIIATEKAGLMRRQFKEWVLSNPRRSQKMEDAFNQKVNRHLPRAVSTESLSLSGFSGLFDPYEHQLVAAARGANSPSVCFNHFTGAGKTFVFAATANERILRGTNNKLCMLVPRKNLEDTASTIRELFPSLNVVVSGPQSITGEVRSENIETIRNASNTLVLMTYETFAAIPLNTDSLGEAFGKRLRLLRAELADTLTKTDAKKVEVKIRKAEAERDALLARHDKESHLTFQELGFDGIMADEAHLLRNLKSDGPAALATKGSARAADFFDKLTDLRRSNPNIFIALGTATVLNRSITEIYNFQRYLQPDALKNAGIDSFTGWLGCFSQPQPTVAADIQGNLQIRANYSITNLPELQAMLADSFDSVSPGDVKGVKIPKLVDDESKLVLVTPSTDQSRHIGEVQARISALKSGVRDPETKLVVPIPPTVDNMLKIYGFCIASATDPRLVDKDAEKPAKGKVDELTSRVTTLHAKSEPSKGTQLVFVERQHRLNLETGDIEFSLPHAIKDDLIAAGIPESEIGIISGSKKSVDGRWVRTRDSEIEEMYEGFRKGRVRVLIGSREMMGVGKNIQDKIVADHYLDVPWNPTQQIQANGRAVRAGNENDEVARFIYCTESSGEAAVISDFARKSVNYSSFWKSARAERSIDDLDNFEMDVGKLLESSADARASELVGVKNKIHSLEARKTIMQQNERNFSANKELIRKRFEITSDQRRQAVAAREVFEASGGHEKSLAEVLTIDGKPVTGWSEDALPKIVKKFYANAHAPRDTEYPVCAIAGIGVTARREWDGWHFLASEARVAVRAETPDRVISVFRALRKDLPATIEALDVAIGGYQESLRQASVLTEGIEEVDEQTAKLKADADRLLRDIETNPIKKKLPPPATGLLGIHRKYLEQRRADKATVVSAESAAVVSHDVPLEPVGK